MSCRRDRPAVCRTRFRGRRDEPRAGSVMLAFVATVIGDVALLGAFAADAIFSARRLKAAVASVIEREDQRHAEMVATVAGVQAAIEKIDARLAVLEMERSNGSDPQAMHEMWMSRTYPAASNAVPILERIV